MRWRWVPNKVVLSKDRADEGRVSGTGPVLSLRFVAAKLLMF